MLALRNAYVAPGDTMPVYGNPTKMAEWVGEGPEGEVQNIAETSGARVVYIQEDVFVHTSTSAASNYSANIIQGQIFIEEKDKCCFVNWVPISTEAVFEDYDVQSDDTEWNIISHNKKGDGKPTRHPKPKAQEILDRYTLTFDTSNLHSIRRSDSKFQWHFLVFVLKDGTTLPALHFHSGGTREFIQHLNRYIWLTKSSSNPKLFVACSEHDHALRKSLDHLQLFSSDRADMFSRMIGNAYVEGLGAFSKVTKLVRDVWTQGPESQEKPQETEENAPENNSDIQNSLDNEFENLLPDVQPDLRPAPNVNVGKAVGMSEWTGFLNTEGKVENINAVKKLIHRGGISSDARKEVWKFLLHYYNYDQSYKERIQNRRQKWNDYMNMKQQWESITPQQEKNFSVFRERKHLVDKDVIRTDRKLSYYKEGASNPNVKKLYDVLMTYCMYNFDLGYVQGMSDLLSPILFIMDDEADAFWCFVGFMEMVADNFEMKQAAIHKQLDNLKVLIQYIYPRLYHHFEKNDSGNLYFCFRWLLILFKREFVFEDVMRLWETLWTQDLSPNFLLFLCLAVLKTEKDYIIENQCGFNEILKHINELSLNIDLKKMLIEAEKLCLQLKEVRNLPDDVTEILTGNPVEKPEKRNFPGKPVLVQNSNGKIPGKDVKMSVDVCDANLPDDGSGDEGIEVLNELSDNRESKLWENIGENTQQQVQDNSEMFVSAVQAPEEELVVLSEDDKAVFI